MPGASVGLLSWASAIRGKAAAARKVVAYFNITSLFSAEPPAKSSSNYYQTGSGRMPLWKNCGGKRLRYMPLVAAPLPKGRLSDVEVQFFLLNMRMHLRTIRCMKITLFAALGMLMALPLAGQEDNTAPQQRPDGRQVHRQRLIQRFDKDGDGKLNDEEKAAMQSFIEERRKNGGERGERRGQRPGRDELIKEFDKDEDGKLSDEERKAMREELAKRHGGEKKEGHRPRRQRPAQD